MKKLIGLFIFTLLLIGLVFIIKSYVGDLRPVLLPPAKNKPKAQIAAKRGEPLDFDLTVAEGFSVGIFARDLGGVRDLVFSPNGQLIASVPSEGKVIVLADDNHDGIADGAQTLVAGLDRPHGIAFFNNKLYIAEETKVSRYIWSEKLAAGAMITVVRLEKKLFDLPKGGNHFTRSIAFGADGVMYVSLGSTCNVCYEKHEFLAAVIVSDAEGKKPELFAKGLRNAPFLAVNPDTNQLWGTEMGRDFLGDTLPPDEVNLITEGGDYGWPVCYGDKVHDGQFDKNQYIRDPCLDTIAPEYKIPAHSAPLGLVFIDSPQFPPEWQGNLLVAYHGSWNSSVPVGYKVVRFRANGNEVDEIDFLTGFLQGGSAAARPVDLVFDEDGNLYISDDKAGYIFVVSKS